MSIMTLCACTAGGGNDDDPISADGIFWAKGSDIYIVYENDDIKLSSTLRSTMYDAIGTSPKMRSVKDSATEHEVVIGRTDRAVSETAYRYLDYYMDQNKDGYIIYTDGTSVAIAYSRDSLLEEAIADFAERCLNVKDGKIELEKGVLVNNNFILADYYEDKDAAYREQQWQTLEKYVNDKGYDGKATVDAFKKLYLLYSDKAYIWLANLYDPVTGGFYYSVSARDTISFAPDLESTRQALDFLAYSGMVSADSELREKLPQEMRENIVAWVQSLQSPTDKKYYHPQWENYEYSDERLGRDVTNARRILSIFGAKPMYASVSSGATAASLLTSSLGQSRVFAVSKVVPTASGHLANEQAFIAYLNQQNWNDSYTSGNRVAAQFTLIKEAGLADVCLDFFDNIQNKETGMWSDKRDDDAVNGFLKISACYADAGRIIKHSEEAADTCIAVLESKEDPHTVCWVYNVWYSLGNIIGLLKSEKAGATDETRALADDIRADLRENAAKYILIAAEKYAPFLKGDGSFSFTPDFSSEMSQNMPVCVSRMREGDVNATYISIISVPARIFSALGYTEAEVDICTPYDFERFLDELDKMEPNIKTNTEYGGSIKFNGDTLEGLFHSTDYTELDTEPDGVVYKGYAYAYIDKEEVNGEENQFVTFGKTTQSILESGSKAESKLSFRTLEGGGSRYIYEMRVRFNGGDTVPAGSWHTKFSMYNNSGRFWYMLAYTNSKGQLCLDGVSDPLAVLDAGKWYTLRFEYYTDSAVAATDKICMVYLDGKYVGDGGTSGSAGKDTALARCMMEYRCESENLSWSLDDVCTTTDEVAYIAPPPPDFGDATGKYYTDATLKKNTTRYDFDSEEVKLPAMGYNNGSAYTELITEQSEDGTVTDKYYRFGKVTENPTAAEDYITFTNALTDAFYQFKNGKTSVVEFDFRYSGFSAATPMKWRFGKDIVVSKNGDSLNLSYSYNGKNTVVPLDISSGTWNNIRLEQYWYKTNAAGITYSIVKVYVNGAYKGEMRTDNSSTTDKFMLYLFKAETKAQLDFDNLIYTHVDKAYVEGDPDAPVVNPGASDEEYKPEAEILDVKGGADGIVVIMHDDGDIDSANLLDYLYKKYSLKGDVALVVNNVVSSTGAPKASNVNSWKKLINTGRWNITNHSYTHTWWGVDNANGTLEKEIVDSQTILRNLFPTQRVLTYAYPGFSSSVSQYGKDEVFKLAYDLVEQYYIGARDYEGDSDGRTNTFGEIDWVDVSSCSIGEGWTGSALNDIAEAAGGKLAVIFAHRVVETSAEASADTQATTLAKMDEICAAIAENVESGKVWNAFLEEAILYLREAEGAVVSVTGDAKSVTVTLTDKLDNEIYNYPLTVRVSAPASWNAVMITQGDRVSYAYTYADGNSWVFDAEIVPDAGEATIVPVLKADVPVVKATLPNEELIDVEFTVGDGVGKYYIDPSYAGDRYDYDSTATELPKHETNGGAYLNIKGGSLYFKNKSDTNEDSIRFNYALTDAHKGYTTKQTVMEFDFKFGNVSATTPFKLRVGGNDYALTMVKGYLSIGSISLGLAPNVWNNVRLESYAAADATYLKIFVNDVLRYDAKCATADTPEKMCLYLMSAEKSESAYVRMDNLFFGRYDAAYTAETPEVFDPETAVTDDATGDYYTNAEITDGTRIDYDTSDATPTVSGSDIPYVKAGSLEFARGERETYADSYIQYNVKSFTGIETPVMIFETDIKFVGFSAAPDANAGWIRLYSNSKEYSVYIKHDGDNMVLTVLGATGSVTLTEGEWHNIRFEIDYATNSVYIYVGGELAGTFANATATDRGGSRKILVYLCSAETTGAIYLDNLYYGVLEEGTFEKDNTGDDNEEPTDPETPIDPDTPTEPDTPEEIVSDATGDYYIAYENGKVTGKTWDYDTITTIPEGNTSYSGGYDKAATDDTRVATKTGSFAIASGALKFEDGDVEFNGDMIAKFGLSYPNDADSYTCTVFEFDFKIDQVYGSYPIQIKLGSNNNLTIWYQNGNLCIQNANKEYVALGTTVGKWSTIRFEAYYADATIKVYVGNEYVLDAPFAGEASKGKITPMIYLTAYERSRLSDANLWIDNVYVGHLALDFVAGEPDDNTGSDDSGTTEPDTPEEIVSDATGNYYIAYENGEVTGKTWDYDVITSIAADSISYSGGYSSKDVQDETTATKTGSFAIVDGALMFEDGAQEWGAAMTAKYWLAYPSDFANYENRCDIFEFDFKLAESFGTSPIQIKIANRTYTISYSKAYDSSYGTGFKLCMTATVTNEDGTTSTAVTPLGTSINAWSTIRFEHYYNENIAKVYVNNEFVLDCKASSGTQDQGTPMIYLTNNERCTGSNADLYVDNVFVGHHDKAYVAGDPNANTEQ